jgi:hypothetical protein
MVLVAEGGRGERTAGPFPRGGKPPAARGLYRRGAADRFLRIDFSLAAPFSGQYSTITVTISDVGFSCTLTL